MPVYKLNGQTYDIPESVVANFEKDNPSATVAYQAGGNTYDIPVSERNGFLKQFPDAVLEGQQPKPAEQPQQPAPTPQQPQAAMAMQSAPQPLQTPQGFGQFNMQQAQQMGMGKGPVSWEQPQQEQKEESVVDKTARIMSGNATPKEQKQVQNRVQQRQDEIAYEQETGKRLRQPVLNPEWEAPTVARDDFGNIRHDENGNVIQGFTTDPSAVSEHQQIVNEQAEWDALSEKDKRERAKSAEQRIEDMDYEETGFLGVTKNKLGAGFAKVGVDFLKTLKELTSGMIVEDASSGTGYSRAPEFDPINGNDVVTRSLRNAGESVERMSRRGEARRDKGFTDLLLDGDLGGFLLKGWGTGLESAPMTLSWLNPYTASLNAISMAGGNYWNETVNNPDIPAWKRASYAIGTAAIEQAVEKFFDPALKYFGGGKILKRAGKEASEEIAKKVTKEAENTIAKRITNVLKDAAGEGAEEVVTNFGNDALGQALDLLDGSSDYGLVAQWQDYKKQNPNAELSDFAFMKAKENLDSFFGGALAGAYTSAGAQATLQGLQYAVGNTVSAEQFAADPNAPIHPATLDIAQSFDEGYTLDNEQDITAARTSYEEKRKRAEEVFGETKGLDEQPLKTIQKMEEGGFSPEDIQVAYDYVSAKATFDGIQQRMTEDEKRSRVNNYNVNGNVVEELDAEGNVIGTHEYENAEEAKLGLFELQQIRANNDMQADISMMKLNPKYDYGAALASFAEEAGLDPEYIESILNKDQMQRAEQEQAMVDEFAGMIHDILYDNTTLHEEQSAEDGENLADEMGLDINSLDETQKAKAVEITESMNAAQTALNELFARNEDLAQEVRQMEAQGMPHQGIISSLDTFRPEDVQIVTDYYNQQAKFQGFINRLSNKIDQEAANSRQRHTMHGTINGTADLNNVYTISDGTNTYYLVSGNITTDPATGQITGSDSGLIIGMDLDGSFVNIGDTNGYSVMPVTQTLDQFEEAERIRLQEQVTGAIDPNGTMAPQPQQEQQPGAVGGEAGGTNATGANEPPTPEAVNAPQPAAPQPEQPATPTIESVTDNDGIKRYEQGVPVDDAIADIENDGYDVNEVADASIAEAQQTVDKIDKKESKTRKDLMDRKKAQDVITYYNNVKQRYAELHPQYADAAPFIQQLNSATSKKKADEILNAAIQAGVNPEEIQPVHTQKVSDIIAKEEERRKAEEDITDRDRLLIRQYKDTPEGRAYLLDRKRVPNAEKRRKIAELIYGDKFDGDFSAWRDLRELISMWLSKGRTLDPDTFGQELGWDMGIGKDAAKVSTMFAARRENGGDGMLFNDFVHMVMEASGGRFTTEDVRNELINMFQGAQEKSDLTEYQLTTRVAEAEKLLQDEEQREADAAEDGEELIEGQGDMGMLPFAPSNEGETRPAFLSDSGVNTDRQGNQAQREDYLTSHPLTEEQIMADTEATEQAANEPNEGVEEQKDYGSDNKLVTRDRYEELKKKMKEKMRGQMNLGVDPEILAIGTEMAVYHIEAGARKFIDYATNMINDLGDAIRPYLKAFYEGARRLPEMEELSKEMDSVADVDAFDVLNYDKQVDNSVNVNKQEDNEPENDVSLQQNTEETVERKAEDADKYREFSQAVANDMLNAMETGEKPYKSINEIRKKAKQVGLDVDEEGLTDILLQELVEDGLVSAARQYVNTYVIQQMLSGKSAREVRNSRDLFNDIVRLYGLQPSITQRSSNRIKMGQFSTPLPMSFVADVFATPSTGTVLEPTAGNGMMVFAVPESMVHANELDSTRLDNLRAQKFKKVTDQDATQPFEGDEQYDAIIANPPFGNAPAKDYDGKTITGLAEQIALNALSKMKDNGKAAIIIGGNMEYAANGAIKNDKPFFTYLYDHYNVKGVVDMDGKLFSKQGTTYPTRMILIDGRRSEEERAQTKVYPPVKSLAPKKVTTFDELYDVVEKIKNNNYKTNGNEVLRTSESGGLLDHSNTLRDTKGERRSGQPNENVSHAGRSERRVDGRRNSSPNASRNAQGKISESTEGNVEPVRGLGDSGVSEQSPATVGREVGSDNGSTTGRGGEVSDRGRSTANNVGETQRNEPSRSNNVGERRSDERIEEKRELTSDKLPYRSHNTAFSLESVAPAAMVEAMDNTLKQIEKEFGNIDDFVTKELGYDSAEEMHNALAAEQVDSVAMAIWNMKKGGGMIIGDQTGVGKGRQMASLIRWAVKQGKKPIFVTKDADLFSDIYRDLVDIGSGELRPFIFNSGVTITDANGVVVHKSLNDATQKKVLSMNELPEGFDFAILSYPQMNTGDRISQEESGKAAKDRGERGVKKGKAVKAGRPTPKADFLRRIAKDNYLLMDESQNAAGSGNTGAYFQSILKDAKAVTFASATFAKRPDTMPLYAIRTAISKAKVKTWELLQMIGKGGVTLQEIMSRAMTQAGQMVRRERDMSDVKTDWKTISDKETAEKARRNYDNVMKAFNAIIDFQDNYIKPALAAKSMEFASMASSVSSRRGTEKAGVDNPPFVNRLYNFSKQLLLSLKVDAVVDEVVSEIEAGRHPVIALENTLESALEDYGVGDVVQDPTLFGKLKKGLDATFRYTLTNEDGDEMGGELQPHELGPEGEQAYYNLVDLIQESTQGMFISPLDAITDKLENKGYKVGEISGRKTRAVLNDEGLYVVRKREDTDRKKLARDFNSGVLDVLIINKTGSTGISLHASKRFSDQRQRTMIMAQPLSDINDYMQMIGRIDRTGQVHRGYYINLGLPVPAETRFMMMLANKLKSLNANTTTSQENKDNDVDAPDLLNKYGDQVMIEYLRDNPDVYRKLGEFLKDKSERGAEGVSAAKLDEYQPKEGDARQITGRVALLSVDEQDAFYDDVTRRYNELIKYLNDTGSNELKISVLPLNARTIDREVSSEGTAPNSGNPFADNAYVEWVDMDILKKPMKASEVGKTIEQLNPDGRIEQIIATVERETQEKLDKENERYEAAKKRAEEDIEAKAETINKQQKRTPEQKKEAIDKYATERRQSVEESHNNMVNKIDANHDRLMKYLKMFEVGDSVLVPDDLTTDAFLGSSNGIFCGFKTKEEGITPSTTLAVFATLDGRRKIEVKLSDWNALARINNMTEQNWDSAHEVTLSNWDEKIPSNSRKHGYIMTGNILQAISDTNFQGRLVTFTDDKGNVRDGVLMPDKWEPSQLKGATVPISQRKERITTMPMKESVTSSDGRVTITRYWGYYNLDVPKSKKQGGEYYLDKTLLDLVDGNNFFTASSKMRGRVDNSNINAVIDRLGELSVTLPSDKKVEFNHDTEEHKDDSPKRMIKRKDNEEKLNNNYEGEKSKDLFLSLQKKEGEEYYETVNELTERVLSGRARLGREGAESRPGVDSPAGIGAQIISADRGGIPAAASVRKEHDADAPVRKQIEDAVESWSKASGYWYDEREVESRSDNGERFSEGGESRIYLSPDRKTITKFNDPYKRNDGGLLKALRNIGVFNSLFPEAAYKVVGYARDKDGNFNIVMEQPFIEGRQYEMDPYFDEGIADKVVEYFRRKGLEPAEEGVYTEFGNEKYYVQDIHHGNVVVDKNGDVHVIDANAKYNEQYKKNVYGSEGFIIEDAEETDPMRAIIQAADSWANDRADDTAKTIDSLASGLKGSAKTYAIGSREDLEALKGKIPDKAYREIEELYNEPDTGAAYLPGFDIVVAFTERMSSPREAEAAWWHEQTHGFWQKLPKAVRERIGKACLEHLRQTDPATYNHIVGNYEERDWLDEACAYLIGNTIERFGTEKFLSANFEGNGEICNFANELVNFIQNGRQESNNQLRQDAEVGQGSKVDGRDSSGRERESESLRDEAKEVTDPIQAIELSAKRWRKSKETSEADMDELQKDSERMVYEERIDNVVTVAQESTQDSSISLYHGQNAIAHDKEIPTSQDAYQAQNRMGGVVKNQQDLFDHFFKEPLFNAVNKVLAKMEWTMNEMNQYLMTKHGLERNRELFTRDWLVAQRKRRITNPDDLNPEEKDIYEQIEKRIHEDFDDGKIDEERRDRQLARAPQQAHQQYLEELENKYYALKAENYDKLMRGDMTLPEYFTDLDKFIRDNIDFGYNPEEHDYSGLTEMYGDEDGKYSEADIMAQLMADEDRMGQEDREELWNQINRTNEYGLNKYLESGMRSEEEIQKIARMFYWYVPMRGFENEKAEDMYQYFTSPEKANSYVGGLIKQAKGRKSKAKAPIATMLAMDYKAISDCEQNLVNQKLYRLIQANPNDLAIVSDGWAVLDEDTGEWYEDAPIIPDDATEDEIRQITLDWEDDMRRKAMGHKAKKITGKADFVYKPLDKKKLDEHMVDVMINGNKRRITIVGNPRMAQALNGHLRYEKGDGIISKSKYTSWMNDINGALMKFMRNTFTSFSPKFVMRNASRDWTHFSMLLVAREGRGYAAAAEKYFFESFTNMRDLFKKYREGTLDESKEIERDFKDFMDNGGITGYVQMKKVDEIAKEMEKIYNQLKDGKVITVNNKIYDYTLGLVESYNEAIENRARFATYRASRHYAGRTKGRSAYDAKEVTANFDKHGAGKKTRGFKSNKESVKAAADVFGRVSQILNANKLFFNATVQGQFTILKGIRNKDGSINWPMLTAITTKYASYPFVMGMAMPFINAALIGLFGGDDGDDPYANLPEWVRRKHLCIWAGWIPGADKNDFITIPVGQELAAFFSLGDIMAGNTFAPQLKPVDKTFKDELLGFLSVFSPVDMETNVTDNEKFAPVSEYVARVYSTAAPLVAIGENVSWMGRPIFRGDKYQDDKYVPEYKMAYNSTNGAFVAASKWLNDVTGGNDVERGWAQINPGTMQYIVEQYTGGPGKVFSNTIVSTGRDVKNLFLGEDTNFKEVKRLEVLGYNAFYNQADDRTPYYRAQAKYRKYKEDADELDYKIRTYSKDAAVNPDHLMRLVELAKSADAVRLSIIKKVDKDLKNLNSAANQATGNERKLLRDLYNQNLMEIVNMLDKAGDLQ